MLTVVEAVPASYRELRKMKVFHEARAFRRQAAGAVRFVD